MEVEANKIKTLERLTVNWFEQQTDIINVVLYNGEYYCIDDPVLLDKHTADKVKIRVIAEVSNEEELYREYFRNIVKAPLNPYAVFLLFHKKGYTTGIPKEYMYFIEKNKDLPITMIERLNEQLIHFKCITTIEPAVLDTINKLLLEAAKYDCDYKRLLEELLKFVETWIEASKYAYPDAETLYSGIMTLVLEDYVKKRKKEEEREEQERGEEEREGKVKSININIKDQREVLPISVPIAVTTPIPATPPVTDTDIDNVNNNGITDTADIDTNNEEVLDKDYRSSSSRSSKKAEEEMRSMVKRTIAFEITYPADREVFVNRLVNKVINSISKVFRRAGLSIQTT